MFTQIQQHWSRPNLTQSTLTAAARAETSRADNTHNSSDTCTCPCSRTVTYDWSGALVNHSEGFYWFHYPRSPHGVSGVWFKCRELHSWSSRAAMVSAQFRGWPYSGKFCQIFWQKLNLRKNTKQSKSLVCEDRPLAQPLTLEWSCKQSAPHLSQAVLHNGLCSIVSISCYCRHFCVVIAQQCHHRQYCAHNFYGR